MRSVTRRSRATLPEIQSGAIDSLVSAFERLLAQGESFTTLSVEQLATEAGIARATFYLHFRNKGELVRHLMASVEKEIRQAARVSLSDIDNFGRSDFLRFMRAAVDIHHRHRAAIRAMVEVSSYDPEVAQVYQSFMEHIASDTRRVIEKLKVNKRHHPAVTTEIADILSWAAERSCSQMLPDNASEKRRQELAELLTHVVWSSIAAPEGGAANSGSDAQKQKKRG